MFIDTTRVRTRTHQGVRRRPGPADGRARDFSFSSVLGRADRATGGPTRTLQTAAVTAAVNPSSVDSETPTRTESPCAVNGVTVVVVVTVTVTGTGDSESTELESLSTWYILQ